MGGVTTEELPSIFANIADTQWPNFIKMCDKLNLIHKYSGYAILAIASDVPAEQLPSFVNISDRILPSVYEEYKPFVITIIAATEHTKWEELANIFDTLKNSIDIPQLGNALYDLAKISADKYRIIRDYYCLIQPMPGSTDPMKITNTGTDSNLILALIDSDVLTVLQKSPQLPDLLRTLKDFACNIDPMYLRWAIKYLDKIPAEHWQNFVDACNLIMQTHKSARYYYNRAPSLVSKIKPSFLPEFIEFVRYSPGFFEKVNYADFSNSVKNATTVELFKTALTALRNEYLPDVPDFE